MCGEARHAAEKRRPFGFAQGKPHSTGGRRKVRGEWAASRQEPLPGSAATPLRMTLDERARRMGGRGEARNVAGHSVLCPYEELR